MRRAKLTLACCAAAVAVALVPAGAPAKTITQNTSAAFGSAGGPNTLPASGSATIYPWNIQVFGLLGKITDVDVTLTGLSHERVTDLEALLVAPGGRNVMFMSDVGDGTDIPPPGVNVTFDGGANTSAPIGVPLISGTFRPTNGFGTDPDAFGPPAPTGSYGTSFSRFKSQEPNGIWSLYLTDDDGNAADPATGSLQGWAVKVSSRLKTRVATPKRKKRGCKRFKSKRKRKKCKRKRKRRR